jgi:hypothetical protein
VEWLCNPASQVSAHFVVTQDGKVYQLVDENCAAWANGIITDGHDSWWSNDVNPNLETISIEHEKPDTTNTVPLTAAQTLASFQLISWLCSRWKIPARKADATGGITGHFSIDPVDRSHCPGTYPWNDLFSYLQQTNGGDLKLLALSDPMGKFFVDAGSNRWHCVPNNVDVAYAILDFYRKFEGVFGLPITTELYLAQFPGTSVQVFERAIIIYDPKHVQESNNPATATWGGQCYLMRIDRGTGAQIIAKPLLSALQAQVSALQSQLAKAQQADPAQITALQTQLANYKQACHNVYTIVQQYEGK